MGLSFLSYSWKTFKIYVACGSLSLLRIS
jgi:hypothetical protein